MSRTFQRAGGALLAALALTGVAQAQTTFHNIYYLGDQPNDLTSVVRTIDAGDDGYIATDNIQGGAALVKLLVNGDLEWVQRYGPPEAPLHAEQVRQNPVADRFVWAGHGFNNGQPFEPFLAAVHPDGQVDWARKLVFSVPAQASDLEIDLTRQEYWIGGTADPGASGEAPWMARYGALGDLKWAKRYQFPRGAQLHSLFPTSDGGAIAVGQVLEELPNATALILKRRMLAFKVDSNGKLVWTVRYNAGGVEAATSEQWLADVGLSGSLLFVTGTITHLCANVPPTPCNPRPSTIFAAIFDAGSGDMTRTYAIFPTDGTPAWANTLAGSPSYLGIGGWLEDKAGEQALLVKARFTSAGITLLQGMLYGDGDGPYRSAVEDVASPGSATGEEGFVFVTKQDAANIQMPTIVRTDQNLSAQKLHCCEHLAPLSLTRVRVDPVVFPPDPGDVDGTDFDLRSQKIDIRLMPCTEIPPPN